MTIRSFDLLRPKSLAEATKLLVKHGDDARPIAGGTTLVILMKQRVVHYPCLVDLQGIPGLDGISQDGASVRIGAMATHRSVERSPIIRNCVPIVAEAFGHIGNVRVRQSASVGGNLAHADPRLDPPPTLLILGAELAVFGPKGSRVIPLKDFYRGMYETALEPAEILFEVKIPSMPSGAKAVYLRYSSLSANDWPCLGVAGLLSQVDGRYEELRLALGGVAETPLLVRGLEFVRNEKITDGLLDEVVQVVDRQISPLSDFRGSEWYKRQMVSLFVKRAIRELEQRFSQ